MLGVTMYAKNKHEKVSRYIKSLLNNYVVKNKVSKTIIINVTERFLKTLGIVEQ